MISRGKLFYIGVLLFPGGFLGAFIVGLVIGFIGVQPNDRYNLLYYVYGTGAFVSLCIGVPLILIGIFMKRERRRQE